MVGLLVVSLAAGADLSAKAKALIDAGELEPARKKCVAWGGNVAGADPALREVCAQVWYADAKQADTVDGWAAFREAWSDTTLADPALEREAELSLTALGASPGEQAFLGHYARYSTTVSGNASYGKAADVAILAIKSDADARSVAERYPDKADALVKTRLGAFVTATVTASDVSDIKSASPLVDAATVTYEWVAQGADGTTRPWSEHVTARLVAHGIPPEAAGKLVADTPRGPVFPLCYDPGAPGVTPGVRLSAGGGTAFLAAPWALACGPDAPAAWLTVGGGRVTDFSTGGAHHVRLTTGEGSTRIDGWSDARALVTPTGPAMVSGGRIFTPGTVSHTVQTFEGSEPWLVAGPAPEGVPLVTTLGGEPTADGRRPVAPLVQRFLGFDPRQLPEAPGPLFAWGSASMPSGAMSQTVGRGDLGSFKQAMSSVGLDPAALGVTTVTTIDLDGDGVIEAFTVGQSSRRPVVVLWQMSTGRVWAWVRNEPSTAPKSVAFMYEGAAVVGWSSASGTDALRWTKTGPVLTRLP